MALSSPQNRVFGKKKKKLFLGKINRGEHFRTLDESPVKKIQILENRNRLGCCVRKDDSERSPVTAWKLMAKDNRRDCERR